MSLAEGALGFVRVLREAGIRVSVGQALDLHRAFSLVDTTDREVLYFAARAVLLSRHSEEPLFSALFAHYWLDYRELERPSAGVPRPAEARPPAEEAAQQEPDHHAVPAVRLVLDTEEDLGSAGDDPDQHKTRSDGDTVATYSASEVLRRKDFGELTPQELAEIRRLIAELRWKPATHRQRRMRRARKGPRIDPRRAMRESLANGGELLVLPRRTHRRKTRPLVLLCDISGSMARYTSMLLRFLHAVRQGRGAVETFVFGTRMTRVTRQLRFRDTDLALNAVATEVLDWGGGTRIGDCFSDFNRHWGRRVLGHDAVVVVISDGWDRGDPVILSREMAHLQRLSYRLVWLNPLLGVSGYQPLTRGMRAAMPHIDDFLAAHNLQSLETLAAFLSDLDEHRPVRSHSRSETGIL